ncbi:T9SS type A sorting domain-containing protein [Pseudoflavitalea sp. X16]|uniref:lamin tail domain-containing protein n=1 Tax=Paraflavitalea devenefica TaxID=2716334 RepID=UPI001421A560|nr:lamin tail domain-containing protein [Paraflavitalea devenefica]NII28691.1 T9SS type A sorting domain-containing protein [Paraflavitalea devenefica]
MKVNTTLKNMLCLPRAAWCFFICILLLSPFLTKAQGRVLINEYLPWPNNTCGTTAEFIELYNFGPGPANIGGYIITDGDYAVTIPANTIILPGEFFVLAGQDIIPQNCGNDLRNVTVNLNWNTCGCTSAPIPTTGDGFITDGGGSNEQVVLLDSNLKIIDAIARGTSVESSSSITTSTAGGQFTARTFDLDNMGIQYETIGESVGRGNSLARKIDGGCGWIKDTQESAGDINNTTGLVLDWNASFSFTKAATCNSTGGISIAVSNALLFPMHYTLGKDADGNFLYDFNDNYLYGTDSTAPDMQLSNLDSGRYRLIMESSLGCDVTMFDFSILGCSALILNQLSRNAGATRNNNNTIIRIAENPFADQYTLLIQAPAKNRMQLMAYDQLGRLAFTQIINVMQGNNSIRLTAHRMQPGIYILQFRDQEGRLVQAIKGMKR